MLLGIIWWDNRQKRPTPGFDVKHFPAVIAVQILLALIYTTPWDNYLVATGVWSYNSALVTGILLGYVPIEEYTFFIAETLLAGLWWWFLARRLTPPEMDFKPAFTIRWVAFGVLFTVWAIFGYLFFFGDESWNYLAIIFFWALPAIFPQVIFGADLLWHYRKLVFWAIIPLGIYLSLMDVIALSSTTWSISGSQTTGILYSGILPLEEVVFFFITNILIGFGMTLMLSNHGRERVRNWKARNFKGLP
jgi:lycopene cyclase domain-containing protein